MTMLCFLTARTLKPGSFQQFRQAWEPPEWDPRFVRAYHVRNLERENEVISFGLYDGSVEDYRAMSSEAEESRVSRMGEFVDEVLVDGVYEVIDEVTPPRQAEALD
jgi:hypothetical protein